MVVANWQGHKNSISFLNFLFKHVYLTANVTQITEPKCPITKYFVITDHRLHIIQSKNYIHHKHILKHAQTGIKCSINMLNKKSKTLKWQPNDLRHNINSYNCHLLVDTITQLYQHPSTINNKIHWFPSII